MSSNRHIGINSSLRMGMVEALSQKLDLGLPKGVKMNNPLLNEKYSALMPFSAKIPILIKPKRLRHSDRLKRQI